MIMLHEQAAEQEKTRRKELSCESFYKTRLVYVFCASLLKFPFCFVVKISN